MSRRGKKAGLGYTFCDTEAAVQLHINSLRVCDTLIVDCEGNNLGCPGGTLSLITIRRLTPPSATYIFDAVALSATTLRPIFDLLESSSTLKILYDGRMDFACFFHDFGITMKNVLDMQIADIQSRSKRGERDNDRLGRLYTIIPRAKIQSQGVGHFQRVHKLLGLLHCAKEHGLTQYQKLPVNHTRWLVRPLPVSALQYAAQDVHLIGSLYQHFETRGYIDSNLAAQSLRYVTMWQTRRRTSNDRYASHCLLPLDILQPPSGALKKCDGCKRDLSHYVFTKTMPSGTAGQKKCSMCQAVDLLPNRSKKKGKGKAPRRPPSDDPDDVNPGYGRSRNVNHWSSDRLSDYIDSEDPRYEWLYWRSGDGTLDWDSD